VGGIPETHALLALMMFHYARLDARLDDAGGLLMLGEQDRRKWNTEVIDQGMYWLWKSGQGQRFSRFHAEAAVMMQHCMAPTFEETRWSEIVQLYEALEKVEASSLHTLNRAIALAEWKGPQAGLDLLSAMKPPLWLTGYYLWDATQGELLRRSGRFEEAARYLERAQDAAPTDAERRVFEKKLQRARSGDRVR
jgi:RNA polymerase sigma-70 factor (ECF subfamily)